MPAEIYIVSGFLGAGKTTLIKKLLKEVFLGEKTALIENDFGEASIDAAILKSESIEVKEINSGCICCSLSGDFVKALKDLLERLKPDKIIIEPSGVGKLSDIVKVCTDSIIKPFAEVKLKITVVDVKRCKMYINNFGEFFEDQIKNADTVLLSKTDKFPEKTDESRMLISRLNPNACIIEKPLNQFDAVELLNKYENAATSSKKELNINCCGLSHIHALGSCCIHDHDADEIFDTITIHTKHIFSEEELKKKARAMESMPAGNVLRAKGIIPGKEGYMSLQYVSGEIEITSSEIKGNMLCIIGQNLNRQEFLSLFDGE